MSRKRGERCLQTDYMSSHNGFYGLVLGYFLFFTLLRKVQGGKYPYIKQFGELLFWEGPLCIEPFSA